MKIIYHASNTTLGDTTIDECIKFRAWAKKELSKKFPDHDIIVSSEPCEQDYTDDYDNEEEILDFCEKLWDACDWENFKELSAITYW